MKKAALDNKLYDVVTMDEHNAHPDLFNPRFTAVEIPSQNIFLPLRGKSDIDAVGAYPGPMVYKVVKPDDPQPYSSNNIIDYSNPSNIGDIIEKDNLVRDIQNDILTTKENVFHININDDDSPELKGLLTFLNTKQFDIRQYESRLPQFQNDIRLLKGSSDKESDKPKKPRSITLNKLTSFCKAFDIEADLILKDASPDVANPANTEIRINLTGGDTGESGEEDS